MRGVVFDEDGVHVRDDIELRSPGDDEVVVRLLAAGVCQSDVKVFTRVTRLPLPLVMGHEGAGIVESIGRSVDTVEPGDFVVLHTLRSCGWCRHCVAGRPTSCLHGGGSSESPFSASGHKLHQFASTSVFVERTIVRCEQVVRVDPRIPPTAASLLSCAVLHGSGAVTNRAHVRAGDTVAVFGAPPLGLNVIQAARIAGAQRIIALDTNSEVETLARRCGAHDFSATLDAPGVLDLEAGGVDHAFVCIPDAAVVTQAVAATAVSGQCVIVEFPGLGVRADFEVRQLYLDKSILGSRAGTADPTRDIPRLVELYLDGQLLLDELIGRTAPLDGAETALAEMAGGPSAPRTVLAIS
ncbi:MAG TPA: alcohol dehydrogenase catalytic domain-containing protein [Acidimicrobiales bacterium]|nr:alcohol dehydrogenase catalytic domain-containing protein [Acidimicrobiales bacterium]